MPRARGYAVGAVATAIMLASAAPDLAAECKMPTIAPSDIAIGPQVDGHREHIVTGVVGLCDATTRSFEIALPALSDLKDVKVQLALSGVGRHYGLHQIGFALASVAGDVTEHGVKVRYEATIDGLERYQLAYTIFVSARP